MRLVSGFWLAAASLLLPPRLHTRLSFWQNARLLTTDGKISAHPPGRGGPTDPRNAEGRGHREGGEEKQQQEGLGDGGSRTSVEGRSHSPARRSSLRSERSRAQLAARQKGSQRFALALFSRRTLLASFCFIILRRHHNQKNKRCLQQQFSAVSRLLLPCLPRGFPPHFHAARIRVLAGCRQLATTAASAHSLVFLAKCAAFNYRRQNLGPPARAGWSNGPEKRRRQRATHHFRPPGALMASLSEDEQTDHWTPEPFG